MLLILITTFFIQFWFGDKGFETLAVSSHSLIPHSLTVLTRLILSLNPPLFLISRPRSGKFGFHPPLVQVAAKRALACCPAIIFFSPPSSFFASHSHLFKRRRDT